MKLDLIAYMAAQQRAERSAEKQNLGSASVDVEGFGLAAGTTPVRKVLDTCDSDKLPLCNLMVHDHCYIQVNMLSIFCGTLAVVWTFEASTSSFTRRLGRLRLDEEFKLLVL